MSGTLNQESLRRLPCNYCRVLQTHLFDSNVVFLVGVPFVGTFKLQNLVVKTACASCVTLKRYVVYLPHHSLCHMTSHLYVIVLSYHITHYVILHLSLSLPHHSLCHMTSQLVGIVLSYHITHYVILHHNYLILFCSIIN